MSKHGEIGDQLVVLKGIYTKIDACKDAMKKTELKEAESACKRKLGRMVRAWDGKPFMVKGSQP